jgi:hypothetical protein
MLVLIKRDLTSKVGNCKVRKGEIFSYDPSIGGIIIQRGTYQIHLSVKIGKDVEEINWVQVKANDTKIKQTPGKGLTFAPQKKKQSNGINRKRQTA